MKRINKVAYKFSMNCPECNKQLIHTEFYDKYDSCTDETYRVYCDYNYCKCGYMDISNSAIRGELMIKAREYLWGEKIISNLTSFKEIEDKFLNRNEVISLIKNYNGERIHPDNKKQQMKNLDYWCVHFVLFNKKYYLKNSVYKFLYCGNGLFPL